MQTDQQIERGVSQREFAAFVEEAPFVALIKDSESRYLYVNREFEKKFRVPRQMILGKTLSDWLGSEANETTTALEQEVIATGEASDERVTVDTPIGKRIWRVSRFSFCSDAGDPMVGAIARDITFEEDARKSLAEAQEQIERMRLLENTLDGMARVSESGSILYANPRFAEFLSNASEIRSGSKWTALIHPSDRMRVEMAIARMFVAGRTETEVRFGDEEERWAWLRLVRDEREGSGAYSLFVREITRQREFERQLDDSLNMLRQAKLELEDRQAELERANAQLHVLATTDGLTGLLNHRTFHERLEEQIQIANRYGVDFSVMVVDVDCFKSFNDTFGHPAGDQALRHFSSALMAEARTTDFVARYGGDEFAVIMPHTGIAGAMEFAERVRRAMTGLNQQDRTITCSAGVASWGQGLKSSHDIVGAADEALYRSKSSGRNTVTQADVVP